MFPEMYMGKKIVRKIQDLHVIAIVEKLTINLKYFRNLKFS
jgi:hypothetical protein